jgi:myotubularin-related protein 1/2
MLNDSYRTIEGFALLVEKEWLYFGHKFHQRCGHGDKNYSDEQRSPIFLQFIDCVWQLLRQFPCSFEFNERFLVAIVDAHYSCRYGTFLLDTEEQRRNAELKRKTVSLWTDLLRDRADYTNVFYMPDMNVLLPNTHMLDVALWRGYYCRWLKSNSAYAITQEMRGLQILSRYEQERDRASHLDEQLGASQQVIALLQQRLKEYESGERTPSPPHQSEHDEQE